MASFQQPLQCVQYVKQQSPSSGEFLIASAGRHLYSYAATTGQFLDVWPKNVESNTESAPEDQAPPEKRRKLSSGADGLEENLKDTTAPKKSSGKQLPEWSNIPILTTSFDGKYVIALTAEDKCIRVFNLGENGKLEELSSREMPKRPSALVLTPDGQTILCGDKFGDAYSLPLIPGEYLPRTEKEKAYKPAATALTVHSRRNLESLEQQRIQAEKAAKNGGVKKPSSEEKTSLNFEHRLIIGHVSLLTDLIAVALPTEATPGRNYILTADRDEHIRVSRGIPQSHIIERYCLGHTSFITKLCSPSWAPEYLISGGGDNYLLLWNWGESQVLQKVSLEGLVQTPEPIVRGIWAVSLEQSAATVKAILVALEGSPELLSFTIEEDTLKLQDTIQCFGNVLDLTGIDSRGSIAVSVDTIREPGSTEAWKSTSGTPQKLLEYFQVSVEVESLKWKPVEDPLATSINSAGTSALPAELDDKQKKGFDDILYTLGVLRKRAYD
ncbi:hypothetical protein N7532_010823 [Penicillium argentinense]|uniref:Transfer RNA methyltransferase 82 n=1 Tax=Penicillium argentinense TaxID=1131581 RepID=A0A9W9EQB9_9EURO|nr:uncharacterized protein N7532_010823 [Penicillium argentinense]KAJ5086052.1 hypothetical protein N7532_010823 [Penicillium argentinense]